MVLNVKEEVALLGAGSRGETPYLKARAQGYGRPCPLLLRSLSTSLSSSLASEVGGLKPFGRGIACLLPLPPAKSSPASSVR